MLVIVAQPVYTVFKRYGMNKKYDNRHGGPYDRGRMDAYYGRKLSPHYYKGATGSTEKITELSAEETEAYIAGYLGQTERKEWD
jgi:hypothetical protein